MMILHNNIHKGSTVIIVDNIITNGDSAIKAVKAAQRYELIVDAVITLADMCEDNGKQNIEALNIPVYSILTIGDFEG